MSDAVIASSETAIAAGSQSFAAAARLFDRQTREDAVMLYAWCRYCDDVVDGQTLGHAQQADFRLEQRRRLDDLRRQTAAALKGGPAPDPVFEALRRVVERHQIPARHPEALLAGFEMDVGHRTYATMSETLDYCYHVAGVVGVMMAMIMGARDDATLDRACDLGLAFQLTNIARDVVEDARAGRVYVPADILARHGIVRIDPDDVSQHPGLHAAALELLDVAELYYDSAYEGLAALSPRSAWAIATARRVYRAIGNKIRAGGPSALHRRVSTTKAEKMGMLAQALGDVARTRRTRPPIPRTGLWQRP
ncbi:phytoene/squalene synthase family protein [Rhizobium sp. SSA_523]|uniref:phytoene/squalene synthase family protein n=1 Tax=Rhizobium sp. SSA_523 TaxID=2952477 RepID=UPI00209119F5|nr:phytoene/squalene synthase family protein [Rhizobium sp. SSA_523]MCO5734751.1 phytoene/squalene synthase family protein [Rhizobium sp. SSA_523]WKC22990.1 phytoene/squalene synthase family protein [Rhizobium sp. SSA_523]